ncbi:MAG TPA: flagellar biosynthetic protein FliO [Melioribacteraceae bacterium]|nr:flagellar biosynthetic protein FliO [Melioribacteraceae bacterium]
MSFMDIVNTILPLLLILGLLFLALIMIRKYSFSINRNKSNLLKIEVMNNHLILPKKYLSVVRVEDKLLLLGISEGNISLIKEYDFDSSDEIQAPQSELKQTFKEILKQNLGMR